MTNLACTLFRLALSAIAAAGPALAQAQQAATANPTGIDALRVEIVATRGIFRPTDEVRVRCTLINPTNAPIDLPLSVSVGPEVRFPRELIFGRVDQPAPLALFCEGEKPLVLSEPASAANASNGHHATDPVRLAPGAMLGVELDLRSLSDQLRYSGDYRAEWRPFGESGPSTSAVFRVEARKIAVMSTDYGKITLELMYETAPRNVENFLDLARSRFYDGVGFHRIVPGFLIQGGASSSSADGMRPDGKTVPPEFSSEPFDLGVLAMALRGSDVNSASCQFFIALERLSELDGKYTIVGRARDEESLRTLRQISELPTNPDGRPLRPVVLRFLTLIDAEAPRGRELGPR